MNKEAHKLVEELAARMAKDAFGELGFDTPDDAYPVLKRQIYLRWGCSNVKAHADCLKTLLELSGDETFVTSQQRRRAEYIERTSTYHLFESRPHSCAPTPGRA